MSGGWKDVVKNGWHPEKNGSSLKSQVKGLVGRGETSSPSSREGYVPPPRSSLRDPASFGPPPKHVAAYGPTAAQQQQQTQAPDSAGGSRTYSPVQPYTQAQHVEEAAAAEAPPPEPKPYRVDTTGLSTSHLPPPPTRYSGGQSPQPPPPARSAVITTTQPSAITAKPKAPPSLPPRLPPRSGNSTPSPSPTSADGQAASQGYLNQGAVNRLGAAGISVPGFGIGGGGKTPPPLPLAGARHGPPPTAAPTQAPGYGQTEELQARFARMGTPSSSDLNPGNETQQQSTRQVPSLAGKKKPPPPPPKSKKPGLSGGADTPPPIPLATRPRFD
ncbi:hypothetical protein F5Y07DRAFT_240096 [Xylaria sp. FL0933]|nr:hypothetical protein F5Y07DRAFT_240096 [Xylaria sp. FL0933]